MLVQPALDRKTQQPMAWPIQPGLSLMGMIGVTIPFSRNCEIYGENEEADHFYQVISGSVRTYKVLSDGRRKIGAFYLTGDVFGLETGDRHGLSAEAICDCLVRVMKRRTLVARADRDPETARLLLRMTAAELKRTQDHVMLLIKTAQERVAGFLVDMSARSSMYDEIDLPMSRQDVADYLGLTIETVSRTLTQFENSQMIAVTGSRRIALRNLEELRRLNV